MGSSPQRALLVEKPGGTSVFLDGQDLYPGKNPKDLPRSRVSQLKLQPQTLVLLASPLLGYGLKELLELLPPQCVVLALEWEPELESISSQTVQNNQHKHLHYWTKAQRQNHVALAEEIGLQQFRRTLLLSLHRGVGLHINEYRVLQKQLELQIQEHWRNRITLIQMGGLWLRNVFRNLPALIQSINLKYFTTSQPILCIGAGPSLDHDIEKIRLLANKVMILCADTALPALLAQGIKPHGVVILESQWWNLRDFVGAHNSGIHAFCDLTSHPQSYRTLGGGFTFFVTQFAPLSLLDRITTQFKQLKVIPPLGNVGNLMAYLAQQLTTGSIFFCGMDYAYVQGQSHAKGAPQFLTLYNHQSRLEPHLTGAIVSTPMRILSKGTQAEPVMTSESLMGYGRILEEMAKGKKHWAKISPTGLYVGIEPLENTALQKILSTAPQPTISENKNHKVHVQNIQVQELVNFTDSEINRLKRLLEELEKMNRGQSNYTALGLESGDLSYLWLHFPDTEPMPRNETSFLVRLLWSARYYLERLQSSGEDLSTDKKAP